MAASRSSSDHKLKSVQGAYTEIIVIRHGETEWNSDGRIQGHLDVDLNEVGRMQAAAVAERLSGESKVSAVYSSDLKRALETAETIASRCGGLEVIQDVGLRERHLGDLQGLVFREAAKICPEAHQALQSDRTDTEIPGGGESFDQLYKRCTSALQRIGNKHKGERVVVVTHGGVIRALQKRASPHRRAPWKSFWNRDLVETSIPASLLQFPVGLTSMDAAYTVLTHAEMGAYSEDKKTMPLLPFQCLEVDICLSFIYKGQRCHCTVIELLLKSKLPH